MESGVSSHCNVQVVTNNSQQFSFQLPEQPSSSSNNNVNNNTETVIQNINNLSLTGNILIYNRLHIQNIVQEVGAWLISLPVNVPKPSLLARLMVKAPRNPNFRRLYSSTPNNWHNYNSCSN